MQNLRLPAIYFATFFVFVMYLLWLMLKPYSGALIFACILAGSFYPFFLKLNKLPKMRKSWAAALMCLFIILIIFIPLIYLAFALSKESMALYSTVKAGLNDDVINAFLFGDGFFARLLGKISSLFNFELNLETIKESILTYSQDFSAYLINFFNKWLGNILSLFFSFFIMILLIFAIFLNGDSLKKYLLKLSPLPDDQEELIIKKFNQMNFVTLICNGLGGLIQGLLAGFAFLLAGFSSVVLWTTMMVVLAFIPLIGISVIYIPACIYLFIKGKIISSVLLFIYCTAVALLTENWFKPKFIGKRIKINSIFVLLLIIGGMSAFGMAGIFYGPIIGIIFLTLVELYHQYYSSSSSV
ncbi:MAG: AI-2E family transporter [Pseudomonadota bacterium]